MTGAGLERPHVWRPGRPGQPPLLLLHGTGGDEHNLLPLADRIAAGAPVLAPRGTVREGRLNRFFRRVQEGVFDEEDVRARAGELADFVRAAEDAYGVQPGTWTAVGFSNGANIAAALLLLHPGVLAGAVLVAGVPPFAEPPQADLTGRRVLVCNGRSDPMAPPESTADLVRQLAERGAEVELLEHDGGHQLVSAHLPAMAEFVRAVRR